MKKLLCLCLTILLVAGILAGCQGGGSQSTYQDDPDEEVTLVMALRWSEQEDTQKVLEAVNKKLETLLPNTKLELLLDMNIADKWSLWMSTSKEIDLAHSGFSTNLEEEVRKEAYLELDELIADYAPNLANMQKKYAIEYANATIAGSLYAVPNVQMHPKNTTVLKITPLVAEYFDMQALKDEAWKSDKTTARFWELLLDGCEKAEAAGLDCKGKMIDMTLYDYIARRGYHFIGGDSSNLCYDNSDDCKVIDFYETEEFQYFCDFTKKMAAKGFISSDILANLTGGTYLQATEKDSYNYDMKTGLPIGGSPYNSEFYEIMLDNPDQTVITTDIGNQMSYWSIPFSSPHPARAMKFLDLLHSEEGAEIVNLLCYGIEGEHYEFVDKENGDIRAFEYQGQASTSARYGIPNWMVCNMLEGMYQPEPYTHDKKEWALSIYEEKNNAKQHKLNGITFELDEISVSMSNIIKNNNEYAPSIYCGILSDTDAVKSELQKKNTAADQKGVMEALQKQIDAFLKNK